MKHLPVSNSNTVANQYNQWPLSTEDMENIGARMDTLIGCICELEQRCREISETMPKVEPRSKSILIEMKQNLLLPQAQSLANRVDSLWRILKCAELLDSMAPNERIFNCIDTNLIPNAIDELTRNIPELKIHCELNMESAVRFIQSEKLILGDSGPELDKNHSTANHVIQLPNWFEEEQYNHYRVEIKAITDELSQLDEQQKLIDEILSLTNASFFTTPQERQD